MSGRRRTERIDVFEAEAGNVVTWSMQASDADIRLLQVAPNIVSWTEC